MATGGSPESIGEALNSDTIRQLRAQEADISRRLSDLEQRYGDKHPERIKAESERRNVETQIQAELSRILSNVQNEVEVSQTRLNTLTASLGASKAS